jgi:peptidyl-prolyl cis-trans isomerase C
MPQEWNLKRFSLFGCIVVFSVFPGCTKNSSSPNTDTESVGQVYATVNGTDLTDSDLRALVPSGIYERLTPEHKANIVDDWIQNELLYQEALKEGIDRQPQIQHLLNQAERQLLSNELLERRLSSVQAPSDDVLKAYYKANEELFRLDANEYQLRYALFDNKEDVNDFHQRVKQNENFSDLARKRSKDPSSQNGGDLGVVNEDQVDPSIWEAIISTNSKYGLHKISDPFTVIDGWACLIIDEKYEAGTVKPFEHVKDLVYDMFIAEKRETAKQELLDELTKDAAVKRFVASQSE